MNLRMRGKVRFCEGGRGRVYIRFWVFGMDNVLREMIFGWIWMWIKVIKFVVRYFFFVFYDIVVLEDWWNFV